MKHLHRSFSTMLGLLFCVGMLRSETEDRSQYNTYFIAAAAEFNVPADVLRGVAFSTTRWSQMQWADGDSVSACSKMPRIYGIMGLWDNDFFGHTLRQAAALIGRSVTELKTDPYQNIRGGAALLRKLYDEHPKPSYAVQGSIESWETAIAQYTGIPQPELSHKHALQLYKSLQAGYHQYGIDIDARPMQLAPIEQSVAALEAAAAARASVNSLGKTANTPDYPLAKWVPGTPNMYYGPSQGYGKVFVVIHDMEGYYTANVSYFMVRTDASIHYCLNSAQDSFSDSPAGEITQMVEEKNYAWHAVCLNRYSLGIEHEGFVSNPAWYTNTMYQSSAKLVKYMCDKYNIPKDRNHIVGHNEWQNQSWNNWIAGNYPAIIPTCNNHTDPGKNWDWTYYMNLVAYDTLPPVVMSSGVARSGQAYDKFSITFNQIMNTSSVEANFSITPSVKGAFSWDGTNRVLTFSPAPFFAFDTTHRVMIDTGAHNASGKGIDTNGDGIGDRFIAEFKTGTLIPPTINLTQPKMNDTAFSVKRQIILRFTDPMDTASVRAAFTVTPAVPGTITWTADYKIMYFTPAAPLAYSTQFTVRIEAAATSAYGARLDANQDSVSGDPYVFTFRTALEPTTAVGTNRSTLPSEFALGQNYPNPFNPSTMIDIHVAQTELVTVKVYDVLGEEIATIVNDRLAPGVHSFAFNASSMPSGVYFYRMQAGTFMQTKRLALQK